MTTPTPPVPRSYCECGTYHTTPRDWETGRCRDCRQDDADAVEQRQEPNAE